MRLLKKIVIDSIEYPLIAHVIHKDLFAPGRAMFSIESESDVKGLVVFQCGYDALSTWFVGYVESCTTINNKQKHIFCRELSAVLLRTCACVLREATLENVLSAITDKTGLVFRLPDSKPLYTQVSTPVFYSVGNGVYALHSAAKIFGIDQCMWQQERDGKVFLGRWSDSFYASRPVQLNHAFESSEQFISGATIPAIPALQPGVKYNDHILTQIEFKGVEMVLTWSRNPWSE